LRRVAHRRATARPDAAEFATSAGFRSTLSSVLRAACIVIAIAVSAARGVHARPAPDRVVLADPDPELLRAVQSTLAPWRLEVIVDPPPPPRGAREAQARADAQRARFVVWRQGGALVVFDRERGSTEERDTAAGPLDPVDAAAAALTVKTLMRLPPPPTDDERPVTPEEPRSLELRGQASLAMRLAHGTSTELGGRLVAAVLVRPLPQLEWRLGIAGDVGSTANIERGGFRGTWSDWAVLALTSWTFHRRSWELEPQLGAGLTRSTLEGSEMSAGRHEVETLALVRTGVAVRRRLGRWTFGGIVGVDRILSTPTYTRMGSTAEIFKVPGFAIAVGGLAAADFGRASW
jgi:hypothetical protein